jgi:hypothetical protein
VCSVCMYVCGCVWDREVRVELMYMSSGLMSQWIVHVTVGVLGLHTPSDSNVCVEADVIVGHPLPDGRAALSAGLYAALSADLYAADGAVPDGQSECFTRSVWRRWCPCTCIEMS